MDFGVELHEGLVEVFSVVIVDVAEVFDNFREGRRRRGESSDVVNAAVFVERDRRGLNVFVDVE